MDQKTIKQLETLMQKLLDNALVNVATKNDLKNFATKDDLNQLKADLIEEIKESEGFIVGSVDRNKVDKAAIEALDKRVTKIENKLAV